ncbi:hypothetical protein [Streptomyces sp. NPDC005017]|uniref:hypothetical protein n=1 Tax=Streptomyces sp. NPDC005017 TaxID=3364706 RepID=UPI0036C6260F
MIRRQGGGAWRVDDNDPRGETNVEIHLPDGAVVWPVQRVMKRFSNGSEDSIAGYGAVLGR